MKALSQASSESGGSQPSNGRHWVIESPLSVKRTAPPNKVSAINKAAIATSHKVSGVRSKDRKVGAAGLVNAPLTKKVERKNSY